MKKYDQNVLPYINNAPAIVATRAFQVLWKLKKLI